MDIYLQKALDMIAEQQGKNESTIIFCVGEQLKDICKSTPGAAELVMHDLAVSGMGIADAEKKIADYAKKNKSGNCGCCPPSANDKILREFYGIPLIDAIKAPQKSISLTDFM